MKSMKITLKVLLSISICCPFWATFTSCEKVYKGKDSSELIFNIGGFPTYSNHLTKGVGTPDVGKQCWEVGDKIILSGGGEMVEIECTQAEEVNAGEMQSTIWSVENGRTLPNVINEAIYAPCYMVNSSHDGLEIREGLSGGEDEYLTTNSVNVVDGEINITFASERNYSRFRVVTVPNFTIEMEVVEGTFYTPNGSPISSTTIKSYMADINGNGFIYGKWEEGTQVIFKYMIKSYNKGKSVTKNLPNPSTSNNKSYTFILVPESVEEGAPNLFSSAGDGGEENPYLIYTKGQMETFLSMTDNYSSRKYYKLMSDIVFEEISSINGTNFTPAEYSDITFDGNFKSISNLKYSSNNATGVGLFKVLTNSTIKNLTLSNMTLRGQKHLAGIAYEGRDIVLSNCHISGLSITTKEGDGGGIGGFIGVASGNISVVECSVVGVGEMGKISCKNSHEGSYGVGGLIGKVDGATVIRDCNVSNLVIDGYYKVGGLIGQVTSNVSSILVSGCSLNVTVGSNITKGYAAGLCGYDAGCNSTNTHRYINNTLNSNWWGGAVGFTGKADFVYINSSNSQCYEIDGNTII